MIEQVKNTEQARSEYRFISGFEMDARHHGRLEGRAEGRLEGRAEGRLEGRAEGRLEGRAEGRAEGIQAGILQGSYQKSLETARLMKLKNFDNNIIMEMTGLSKAEVEKL